MGPGLVDSGLTEAVMHGAGLGLQAAHLKRSQEVDELRRQMQAERLQNLELWHQTSAAMRSRALDDRERRTADGEATLAAKQQGAVNNRGGLMALAESRGLFGKQQQDPAWQPPTQPSEGTGQDTGGQPQPQPQGLSSGNLFGAPGGSPSSTDAGSSPTPDQPGLEDAMIHRYRPDLEQDQTLDRGAASLMTDADLRNAVHQSLAASMLRQKNLGIAKGQMRTLIDSKRVPTHLLPGAIGSLLTNVHPNDMKAFHDEFSSDEYRQKLEGLMNPGAPLPDGQAGPPAPVPAFEPGVVNEAVGDATAAGRPLTPAEMEHVKSREKVPGAAEATQQLIKLGFTPERAAAVVTLTGGKIPAGILDAAGKTGQTRDDSRAFDRTSQALKLDLDEAEDQHKDLVRKHDKEPNPRKQDAMEPDLTKAYDKVKAARAAMKAHLLSAGGPRSPADTTAQSSTPPLNQQSLQPDHVQQYTPPAAPGDTTPQQPTTSTPASQFLRQQQGGGAAQADPRTAAAIAQAFKELGPQADKATVKQRVQELLASAPAPSPAAP